MAKLTKGHTYNPGDIVDAADLNALVDNAGTLYGIIMEQTPATLPINAADDVLVVQGGSNLRRANVSDLIQGVSSVDWAVSNPAPTAVFSGGVADQTGDAKINLGFKNQAGNKALLSPLDGTSGVPGFRVLAPADITSDTVAIAAVNIDWSLGNVFAKTLTTNTTFTFSNVTDGQTIRVRVKQTAAGTATVDWNPGSLILAWCDGITPEVTTEPNGYSIFVFTAVTGPSAMTIHGFLETVFTFGLDDLGVQGPKKFLAGPVSGAAAAPTFRAIAPADTSSVIGLTGTTAVTIDLTLGNVFSKQLTAAATAFSLTGGISGQQIKVWILQNLAGTGTVSWSVSGGGVLRWRNGTVPVMTTGNPAYIDIFTFICIGNDVYGYADQNFI